MEKLQVLNEYKAIRVKAFLYKVVMIGLSVYQVYNKTTPLDPSTVATSQNFLSSLYINYLYYVIVMMRGESPASSRLDLTRSALTLYLPTYSYLQESATFSQLCKLEDAFHFQGDNISIPNSNKLVFFSL